MSDAWETVGRPGTFGPERDRVVAGFDNGYGAGRWRLVWRVGRRLLSFAEVVLLYEEA